jgi:Pyruvate/2-oxoacid:ferredoxin oxidoreductase delta subunit
VSLSHTTALRVVLYEGQQTLDPADTLSTLTSLLERGFAVSRIKDASGLSAPPRTHTIVLGKFNGNSAPGTGAGEATGEVDFHDIAGMDAEGIAQLAESARSKSGALPHGEWKPWFPVIDYDRCTNCMQCLSFCLFGVYGVDEQHRIQAQNQDQCKTNCPACSRVCPEAAIMFPKYKAGPINGDVVRPGDVGKEKMKVDISALLGGDVYSALRQRTEAAKARFSKERDEKKALSERQSCLTKLAQAGDIPMEVLMSLPSPEEIQRRAEEARTKAAAALAAQRS